MGQSKNGKNHPKVEFFEKQPAGGKEPPIQTKNRPISSSQPEVVLREG
jgi:hypothetical protein